MRTVVDMKLYDLLSGICTVTPEDIPNIEIDKISSDSRDSVSESTLFVALKGAKFDAHEAVPELSKKGVQVFVVEHDCGVEHQIVVRDSRLALSTLWANWYHNPERKLKLIGITGTNGKTTTTTVIKRLLDALGIKAGLIGTCGNEVCDRYIHTENTTPMPNEFFELLSEMVDAGCEYAVMEASSQGLEQERLGKCVFEVSAFLNLTQDHLDVHGTMENYYQAKKLLFLRSKNAVIDIDDPYGERLFNEIDCPKYTLSTRKEADFYADMIKLSAHKTTYWYSNALKSYKVEIPLPGSYNVSNAMTAIAVLELAGIGAERTVPLISKINGVRGRCEVVPTGRDFTVIIDYAHSPDAITNILKNVRESAGDHRRIVCLFGCGGDRDAKKRPLMAKAAENDADFLIITSDNPRSEDPHAIIMDIIAGLSPDFKEYIEIDNRRDAIFWAIKNAKKDDVIVLCGKGHEDYQILSTGKIHFDEREVVAEALQEG